MVTTMTTIGLGLVCLYLTGLIRKAWNKNASDSQKSLYVEFRESLKQLAALIRDVSTVFAFFGGITAMLFMKISIISLPAMAKFIAAVFVAFALMLLQLL